MMANCKHTVRITAGKVYYPASAGMFLSRNVQQISIEQLAECHYDNTRNLNLIQSYLSVACFGFSPIYLSVLCSMSYSLCSMSYSYSVACLTRLRCGVLF